MLSHNSKVKMQNFNSKFKTDLRARCYRLSLNVIALADTLPQKRSSWVIADQLIRSTTSIGANLVEARASSSRLEFKKFYEISLKSANETLYWMELLRDANLTTAEKVTPLHTEATEVCKMLAASIIKLKSK